MRRIDRPRQDHQGQWFRATLANLINITLGNFCWISLALKDARKATQRPRTAQQYSVLLPQLSEKERKRDSVCSSLCVCVCGKGNQVCVPSQLSSSPSSTTRQQQRPRLFALLLEFQRGSV